MDDTFKVAILGKYRNVFMNYFISGTKNDDEYKTEVLDNGFYLGSNITKRCLLLQAIPMEKEGYDLYIYVYDMEHFCIENISYEFSEEVIRSTISIHIDTFRISYANKIYNKAINIYNLYIILFNIHMFFSILFYYTAVITVVCIIDRKSIISNIMTYTTVILGAIVVITNILLPTESSYKLDQNYRIRKITDGDFVYLKKGKWFKVKYIDKTILKKKYYYGNWKTKQLLF